MHTDIKVLVLEDEPEWAQSIGLVIKDLGWSCSVVSTVSEAQRVAAIGAFDIAIIDRVLADASDGLGAIDAFRELELTMMVLVVSQLSTTGETVTGLNAGADDYLAKPFDATELRARLVAMARRVGKYSAYPTVVLIDGLEVRHAARTVTWRKTTERLADKLFDVLWVLVSNAGSVVSKDTLWREVWVEFARLDPQVNTIEVSVARLRKQLKALTGKNCIQSVRGRGYRIVVD